VDKPITIYGAAGTGSVPIEAALTLIGRPYAVIEIDTPVATWRDRLVSINPMAQVPALILPDGQLMTESAAILIWLAETHPDARLSPGAMDAQRPAFLRWMAYVSAAIYALYWVRDDPLRLAPNAETAALVKARTAERISECWRLMDAQVSPGRYILGEDLSVLDLYVTVLSRWGPRRKAFYENAPKMTQVVRRIDADPRLTAFWAARFPFQEGWEG
jgi:GST-like protein